MRPATHDWPVYAGEPSVLQVTLTDGTDPLTLTGTWQAQARRYPGADAVEIDVDTSQMADGVLTLTVPADAFSAHTHNEVWDLEGSLWGTVLAGTMPVTADVTRADPPAGGSVVDLVAALGPDEVQVVSTANLGPVGPQGPPGDGIFGVDEDGPYYSLTGAAEGESAPAIIEDGSPVLLVEV